MSTEGVLRRPLTSDNNSITSNPIITLGFAMWEYIVWCERGLAMFEKSNVIPPLKWFKYQRILLRREYFCLEEMTKIATKSTITTHFLFKKDFTGLDDNIFLRGRMLKGPIWDKILQLARWQVVETLPLVGGTMDNAVSCLPRCSWPFPLTAAEQIRQHTKTSKRTQT